MTPLNACCALTECTDIRSAQVLSGDMLVVLYWLKQVYWNRATYTN